ncbi:MAG: fasciclin domain-containing protein [Verrucomicrobiales bacterium]|nr:fasciclin domain-containing protein [Verrucomicrobiales bacterium]
MRKFLFTSTPHQGQFSRFVHRHSLSLTLAAVLGTSFLQAESPEEENTIGRRLESSPQASTFIQLLKDTDNSKNLLFDPNQTLTVFVPTNAAFEKLDDETKKALFAPGNKHWRERVLAYHAVHGARVDRYILGKIGLVENGVGQYLRVGEGENDSLTIDDVAINETDFICSNGVVHFIDDVLDPVEPDLFETLEADGRFGIFSQLLKRSGLTKLLQNRHKNYTVFAPTDEAFATLPKGTIDRLMAPENLDLLNEVILAHIVDGIQTVSKVPGLSPLGTEGIDVRNQYRQELTFQKRGDLLTIDGVEMTETDRVARNGIYHVISRPISAKRQSLITTLEDEGNYGIFLDLLSQAGLLDLLGQFGDQTTVFAPVDEAFTSDENKELLEKLREDDSKEILRGLLFRHLIDGRIPLTNAIAFQRFDTNLKARVDVLREGDKRWVQGVEIVETDLLARNGIAHGIRGLIPATMELPDSDQDTVSYLSFVEETLIKGSELVDRLEIEKATDYYAARGYEFLARYGDTLNSRNEINASKFLSELKGRNQAYEFALTAWRQRNGFRNLQRELEKVRRTEFDRRMMLPLQNAQAMATPVAP